jgi:hypothetical protein
MPLAIGAPVATANPGTGGGSTDPNHHTHTGGAVTPTGKLTSAVTPPRIASSGSLTPTVHIPTAAVTASPTPTVHLPTAAATPASPDPGINFGLAGTGNTTFGTNLNVVGINLYGIGNNNTGVANNFGLGSNLAVLGNNNFDTGNNSALVGMNTVFGGSGNISSGSNTAGPSIGFGLSYLRRSSSLRSRRAFHRLLRTRDRCAFATLIVRAVGCYGR